MFILEVKTSINQITAVKRGRSTTNFRFQHRSPLDETQNHDRESRIEEIEETCRQDGLYDFMTDRWRIHFFQDEARRKDLDINTGKSPVSHDGMVNRCEHNGRSGVLRSSARGHLLLCIENRIEIARQPGNQPINQSIE